MDLFIKLCFLCVIVFYIYTFIAHVPKYVLLKATCITIVTVTLVSLTSFFVYIMTLVGTKSVFFASQIKFGFIGFIEEYCRSKFLMWFSKDKGFEKAQDLVLGVSYLYGLAEAFIIYFSLFSNDFTIFFKFILGDLGNDSEQVIWPSSYWLTIVLSLSLILRYYVHKSFLTSAVRALFEEKKLVFIAILLIHGIANIFFVKTTIENVSHQVHALFLVQIFLILLLMIITRFCLVKGKR